MHPTVDRVRNRAKREILAKVPPAALVASRRHNARLSQHAPNLPILDSDAAALVEILRSDGVAYTTLDELDPVGAPELKRQLSALAASLAARDCGSDSITWVERAELLQNSDVWAWGLNERVLAIAENYIGLPITYFGGFVVRQIADGKATGDRQWHRDIEDRRMLKILIWLEDVGPDGGAFEYVSRNPTVTAARRLRYVGGFLQDAAVAQVIDKQDTRKATGPQWTAVLADTAQVFHRAGRPTSRDRYSVTFTWSSQSPLKTIPSDPFTAEQAARIRAGLDERQLAVLPAALRAVK
jgi:hypothetical protein